MIVFDLICSGQHRFEGWFRSSDDFAQQQENGLLSCPRCDSSDVSKAPMAPAVPMKMNRITPTRTEAKAAPDACDKPVQGMPHPLPGNIAAAFARLAAAQAKALPHSKWVGSDFADRSRAIHYGEVEDEAIHGRASPEEAVALLEEGVVIAPLLVPFIPPEETN